MDDSDLHGDCRGRNIAFGYASIAEASQVSRRIPYFSRSSAFDVHRPFRRISALGYHFLSLDFVDLRLKIEA